MDRKPLDPRQLHAIRAEFWRRKIIQELADMSPMHETIAEQVLPAKFPIRSCA